MKKITFLFVFAVLANLAFGQIAFRATSTSTATTTSISIPMPAGVVQNDVMIAIIAKQGNTSDATGPAGWNLIDGANLNGGTARNGSVLYKIAGAAEAGPYSFSLGAGTTNVAGTIIAFSGVDVSGPTPFDVAPGTIQVSANGTTSVSATAISTASANAAVIMCGMAASSNPSWNNAAWSTTSPGSLAEIADIVQGNGTDGASAGAAWALKAAAGSTGAGAATLSASERNGGILIALKPISGPPPVPNLWSANGTGDILKYTVDGITGNILAGPTSVVTPLTSTAAIGKNAITANDLNGCIYYTNRDDNNTLNGVVTIYAVRPDGTGNGSIGTIDMNGPGDNTDFSFVRLGFDALGRGWIIAGGQSTSIYIASFLGKGTGVAGQLTPADINTFGNVPLTIAAPGSPTEFQNGDLAISGNGNLYALANVTGGQTYVYSLNSLSAPTTLTRKWTVQTSGGTFSGSVNGLAWTLSGSLLFSTGAGLYFIDQATANTSSGTVQATLVPGSASSTLTDLASDKFPQQSTLPLKLTDFTVTRSGNNALLNWSTAFETNTDHFEIERSYDGINFNAVGSKQAAGNSATDVYYQFVDPISLSSGNIYYQLKTLDLDGKPSYSKIVVLRLNGSIVKNFTVYPNPFTDNLKLEISSDKETEITIRISNALGQPVISRSVILQKGSNVVVLSSELQNLKPGMHLMEIISEDGKMTQKIIKR